MLVIIYKNSWTEREKYGIFKKNQMTHVRRKRRNSDGAQVF